MSGKPRKGTAYKIENGQRFGSWTVIGPAKQKHYFQCVCDCGHRSKILQYNLFNGKTTQCVFCARAMPKRKELFGKRFGNYTVTEYLGRSRWCCRCDCGTENICRTWRLKRLTLCRKCSMWNRVDQIRITMIRAALDTGASKANIARVLKISPQRVSQIVNRLAEHEKK